MANARRRVAPPARFADKLLLNQWMLSLFGVSRLDELASMLRNEALEGLDENNVHHFHRALTDQLFNLTSLPTALLLEYDQNIVTHTLALNEERITRGEEPIVWKYFQYLTLLFTEIYLDRYFTNPGQLRSDLNARIAAWNEGRPVADQVQPLDEEQEARLQLNKVAFWSATGSGKTLLMHANIKQYQHYLDKSGRARDLNRTILLTPNEGLTQQHLREFELAGIQAEPFTGEGRGLFSGHAVEVLDIHKLREEKGVKTFAIEAFEGNNLVMVDEGHRGASRGEEGTWMRYRDALCSKGFSFEYSATFGQAVKSNKNLSDLYARSILFDYSYPHFYSDGFGKDYQILNLERVDQERHQELYLVACLLAFYQQQRLFREERGSFARFNLEKPLWIFVGGKVTASLAAKDASDIIEILQFLGRYVGRRQESVERIRQVLTRGLETSGGRNLFAGRFAHLDEAKLSAEQVYEETLEHLFNARGGGALHVENLKGTDGEVALRVGENEPFGVINVGDSKKLCDRCEERHSNGDRKFPELVVSEKEFSGSLFQALSDPASPIHVLIGSKKFTEGWNSWRVSTMGLMNVGASEGAQIIQLFGRGVRLKGYGMSLKRSSRASIPQEVPRPKHLAVAETLNVFGVHADYMATFRDILAEEGLPANEDRVEFLLPVIRNLGTQGLRTIRLKKTINGVSTDFGSAFRLLGPVPTLARPDAESDYLRKNQVVVNWYPKIQAMKSAGLRGGEQVAKQNRAHLAARHLALLDFDRLFFDLERYKAERGWYNLNLPRADLRALLEDPSWYTLLIPEEELAFDSYRKVQLWQEIALALLRKYTERYYTWRKRDWEMPHLEYRDLEGDDANFLVREGTGDSGYRILVDQSRDDIVARLEELRAMIESEEFKPFEFHGLKALWFQRHLYQPLLYLDGKGIEISPAPLNQGERRFVEDLKKFHDGAADFFAEKELYLLRNLSRGRGVGFFEAGNFHPDFILWLLAGGRQHVVFVDPKGIRHLGRSDPKIMFHQTIKEIEDRLGDGNVLLHSYIVSNTPAATMEMLWEMTKAEMRARHILFQEEDADTYVLDMLEEVVGQQHKVEERRK